MVIYFTTHISSFREQLVSSSVLHVLTCNVYQNKKPIAKMKIRLSIVLVIKIAEMFVISSVHFIVKVFILGFSGNSYRFLWFLDGIPRNLPAFDHLFNHAYVILIQKYRNVFQTFSEFLENLALFRSSAPCVSAATKASVTLGCMM